MNSKRGPIENERRAAVRKLFPESVTVAIERAERSGRRSSNHERTRELYERTERALVQSTSSAAASRRSAR
jgi:hypothetical protein